MSLLEQLVPFQLSRRRPAMRMGVSRLRGEGGSALVELALTLSILGVPLLLGTAHYAELLINSIVISNAAHAGAEYGMHSNTLAGDSATIISAAQDDAGIGTNLHVVPTVFFACSTAVGGTRYPSKSAADPVCTVATGRTLELIQVVASADVTPGAKFPGAPNTVTLSSTSVMVVQE